MPSFPSIDALESHLNQSLGTSDWVTLTQDHITAFAEVTGDHQWIHTDPDRAKTQSPFGGTIAHGFLVLSLLSKFIGEILKVDGVGMGINYGLNRVRFTSPVPVNSRLRAEATLLKFEAIENGARLTSNVVVSREGQEKPVCVAEAITLLYKAP